MVALRQKAAGWSEPSDPHLSYSFTSPQMKRQLLLLVLLILASKHILIIIVLRTYSITETKWLIKCTLNYINSIINYFDTTQTKTISLCMWSNLYILWSKHIHSETKDSNNFHPSFLDAYIIHPVFEIET